MNSTNLLITFGVTALFWKLPVANILALAEKHSVEVKLKRSFHLLLTCDLNGIVKGHTTNVDSFLKDFASI